MPNSCTKPDASGWLSWWPKISAPDVTDCIHAIEKLKQTDIYTQGSTVTAGTCEVEYSTPSDIEGAKLQAAAKAAVVAIIDACEYHQGTYTADGPEISVKKPSVKETE